MSFFKNLFGSGKKDIDAEQEQAEQQKKRCDTLKYDGVRALKMNEYALAVRFLSEAATLNQGDAETQRFLAEAYLKNGDTAKALPLLQCIVQREPSNLNALLILAQAAGRLGQWASMLETLQKAYLVDAQNARVYYLQGMANHGLGDDTTAAAMLTKAIEIDPTMPEAYYLRAQVFLSLGKGSDAERDADALLKDNQQADDLWLLKGDALRAQGRNDEALEAYAKARQANPFNRESVLRQVAVMNSMQRDGDAVALLNVAIDEQPDFADAYKARAEIKKRLGDEQGAEADNKKAAEVEPPAANAKPADGYADIGNRLAEHMRESNPFGMY